MSARRRERRGDPGTHNIHNRSRSQNWQQRRKWQIDCFSTAFHCIDYYFYGILPVTHPNDKNYQASNIGKNYVKTVYGTIVVDTI